MTWPAEESVTVPSVPEVEKSTRTALSALRDSSKTKIGQSLESNVLNADTQKENWDSKSFLDMRDKVREKLVPQKVRDMGNDYKELGRLWANALREYQDKIVKVTETHWKGRSAAGARSATQSLVGDFPDKIEEYGKGIGDRLNQAAEVFDKVYRDFPETPNSVWDSPWQYGDDAEFNTQSVAELENLYSYKRLNFEWGWTKGDRWQFANYGGKNSEPGSSFDQFKKILDDSYKAAAEARVLMRDYYAVAIQDSMMNLPDMPTVTPAKATPTGGVGGGGGTNGGGGGKTGGGGGGGGGQTAAKPDVGKALDEATKKLQQQQQTQNPTATNASSENPLGQAASTATQALGSLGSQASQAAQQALSQAQQAAQKAAQDIAGKLNTPDISGIHGGVSPVSHPGGSGVGAAKTGVAGAGGGGTGGGGGGIGGNDRVAERTAKTGTTQQSAITAATSSRPTAGVSQAGVGGAGAPMGGGHGGQGGGDKVHKVLKALKTRVNGEEAAGLGAPTPAAEPVVEGAVAPTETGEGRT